MRGRFPQIVTTTFAVASSLAASAAEREMQAPVIRTIHDLSCLACRREASNRHDDNRSCERARPSDRGENCPIWDRVLLHAEQTARSVAAAVGESARAIAQHVRPCCSDSRVSS